MLTVFESNGVAFGDVRCGTSWKFVDGVGAEGGEAGPGVESGGALDVVVDGPDGVDVEGDEEHVEGVAFDVAEGEGEGGVVGEAAAEREAAGAGEEGVGDLDVGGEDVCVAVGGFVDEPHLPVGRSSARKNPVGTSRGELGAERETPNRSGFEPRVMAQCDVCGREEGMPYRCRLCGGTFCSEHRLPENHDCPGLEEWHDPAGVFGQGDGGASGDRSEGVVSRMTSTGGPLGYVRGNVSYLLLGLIWMTFIAQFAVFPLVLGIPVGSLAWVDVFTVNTVHPFYVWTWVTSIFSHSGFSHILFNSIALYFFGPYVERRIGSKAFLAFFLAAGVLAGVSQLVVAMALGETMFALGASGAIMGIMGIITVLNPDMRVLLYFFIPVPIWLLTAGYALISVAGIFGYGGVLTGGVANAAHLAGLVVGLVYGRYLKEQGTRVRDELRFGGGRF